MKLRSPATIVRVDVHDYLTALSEARMVSDRISEATTRAAEMPRSDVRYYLTADALSGYGVTGGGELVGVFSRVRGRGEALVSHAIEHGAVRLDCFDGYLPTLYGRHGFVETARVPNWTPGGPDVVYMARQGAYQTVA